MSFTKSEINIISASTPASRPYFLENLYKNGNSAQATVVLAVQQGARLQYSAACTLFCDEQKEPAAATAPSLKQPPSPRLDVAHFSRPGNENRRTHCTMDRRDDASCDKQDKIYSKEKEL